MIEIRKKHRTSKLKSFFFFLLLALISWVLTKFSQVSTSTVMANLVYSNTPAAVSVSSNNLNEIAFDISTNGFQFLSFQLKRPKIDVDISKYYKPGDSVVSIPNTEISKIITAQLDNNTLVKNINIEELTVDLDLLMTKKVPVRFNSELDFKDGYRFLSSPKISPDSITISGPSKEVEKTKEVMTVDYNEKSISENVRKRLPIKLPENTQLLSTPNEVEVYLEVDEFTEKRLTIPVEVRNIPEGTELKLLPESVNLTFNVSVNSFNDVTENDFQIVCDFSKRIINENFMVPKLVKQPSGIHHIEIGAKRIEYLIFK